MISQNILCHELEKTFEYLSVSSIKINLYIGNGTAVDLEPTFTLLLQLTGSLPPASGSFWHIQPSCFHRPYTYTKYMVHLLSYHNLNFHYMVYMYNSFTVITYCTANKLCPQGWWLDNPMLYPPCSHRTQNKSNAAICCPTWLCTSKTSWR